MADELWAFAATSEDAARRRDDELMAEYDACSAASSEIFDNAMWLRLGKAPSKQAAAQMDRRGGTPLMVQAGQGALLSRLRQQQQLPHQLPEQMVQSEGEQRFQDKRRADDGSASGSHLESVISGAGDDGHANLEFVMGGGGALRVAGAVSAGSFRGSRASSQDSSPVSWSPASPSAGNNHRGDKCHERSADDGRTWLGGDEVGRNSLRRAAASDGAVHAGIEKIIQHRKNARSENEDRHAVALPQGGHRAVSRGQTARDVTTRVGMGAEAAHGGAPLLSGAAGGQSGNAVLHRLALLRKELQDKRDADNAGIALSLGKSSGGGAAARRHAMRGSGAPDGARWSESGGSGASWAPTGNSERGRDDDDRRAQVIYSKPMGSVNGSAHANRIASAGGVDGRQCTQIFGDEGQVGARSTGGLEVGIEGGCHSGRGGSGLTAPLSRDGDRDRQRERAGEAELAKPNSSNSARDACGEDDGGKPAEIWANGTPGDGSGMGLAAARKEVRGFAASLFGSVVQPQKQMQMTWGGEEGVGKKQAVRQQGASSRRAQGAGLFQALEAGGNSKHERHERSRDSRPGTSRWDPRLGEFRACSPSAPPKLDM